MQRTDWPSVPRVLALDHEALPLIARGDRAMIARLQLASRGEAEIVTSPITVVEARDGRTTEQRWDWVLSRVAVADVGKDEARKARRLLAAANMHGHQHAIDAILAVVAGQQKGDVTIYTSDVADLERLVPATVVVQKV